MRTDARPIRRRDLEPIKRPDGQALFDPATQSIHALNATSMAIWEACDGSTTVEELAAAVAELGGLDASVSAQLVEVALAELTSAGLIADG